VSFHSTVVQRHLAANFSALSAQGPPADRMSPVLDDLSMRFVLYARLSQGDVLDIGCGDGVTSVAALTRGARLYAVDPDQAMLHHLLARVPPVHAPRLRVRIGSLPSVNFKFPRFSAVHVSRVLHLLDPLALQRSLQKFFHWLYPDGKLFLSTLTSAGDYWSFAESQMVQKKLAEDPWPGYIADVRRLRPHWDGASDSVHLLDESILRRELAVAGFEIEYLNSYPLPWDVDQMCCGIVARCGE
jgi:cyclopropane fatty-acyl-phospholipid synthase-like methyltransferase